MKITVITISYNSVGTIERTINSVLSQLHNNIEYIIVDGDSKDGTVDVIQKYDNNISKWISEPDEGIYDAMNKGLALATGDVVGLLNADDYFADEGAVNRIVEAFENSDCDATYADLVYKKGDKLIRKWYSGGYTLRDFDRGWMPPHPTFYVKRSCYEKYGNYLTDMPSAADYELMLRFMYKYKLKAKYIMQVQVCMEVGGVSNSSIKNRLLANKDDVKAWRINGLKMPLLLPILKPMRKLPQWIKALF